MISKLNTIVWILLIIVFSANAQEVKLEGKWENEKGTIVYEFDKKGGLYFEQNGQGVFVESYHFDTSKTPFWLDFTIKFRDLEQKVPALLEVIDNNTIKIEQFPPYEKHPENFSENIYNIHVLKRIK